MFPGDKVGRCVRLTILPPTCAVFMKSGYLNFLERSGPLQACNGTALPFTHKHKRRNTLPACPATSSIYKLKTRSQNSDYTADLPDRGSNPWRGKRIFSSPDRLYRLWSSSSFLFNVYRSSITKVKRPARVANPHTSTPLTRRHGPDRAHIHLHTWILTMESIFISTINLLFYL